MRSASLYSGSSGISGMVVAAIGMWASGASGVGIEGAAHQVRATITPNTMAPTMATPK